MYCVGKSWKHNRRRFQTVPEETSYLQVLIFPEVIKACFPLVGQYLCLKNHVGCYSCLSYSACFLFVWLHIDRIDLPSAETIWIWQLGQLLCWPCCQEVWKGIRVRGCLLQSERSHPSRDLQTLLYKLLRLGLCVSPHSCCTELVLLDCLSLTPLGGRCRPHVVPVHEGRKRNSCIKPIFTSRITQ